MPYPNYNNKFSNSFFLFFSRLWNNLQTSLKSKDLVEFKKQLKIDLKPPKIYHFSKGSKLGNSLITRIRVGRSYLNLHKFTIGLAEKPDCDCHAKQESSSHFILDCFLYTAERQNLYNLVEHYIPNFPRMTKTAKLNLLLSGFHTDNPEYNHTNTIITIAVQNFIIKTKRFIEDVS